MNVTNVFLDWNFLIDLTTISVNFFGIVVVIFFIFTVIRLDHPSYSISNLIGCHTCFAVGLANLAILINSCSSFFGDRHCFFRGIFVSVTSIYMNLAFCIKAWNRCQCIVFSPSRVRRPFRSLLIFFVGQWTILILLSIPLISSDSIEFDLRSNLCLIRTNKFWQWIFLVIISCCTMVFICSVYLHILYYVVHLPIAEKYRRKRQLALLRRIPILLVMILTPGLINSIVWIFFDDFYKFTTLIVSFFHTGAVITIFISNTRLRRQCCRRRNDETSKSIYLKISFHSWKEKRRSKLTKI